MKENIKSQNVKKEKKVRKLDFAKNKKIFLIIGCTIIIVLIITGICFLVQNLKYKKYKHYEDKMNAYGFNTLYDNGSAKTSEKVTKSEAIKMAIGTCLNTFDIEGIANVPTEDYQNAIWVLYAQDANLVEATDLNKDTANKKAKYIEVIKYFSKAKEKLLDEELVNETDIEISDLDKYSLAEQNAIFDMISNDILKVLEDKLDGNKKIFKGQLNEIVVNYIEKYNLFDDKIQTDIAKLPNNASDYAYISQDVAKEIYEIPYDADIAAESEFKMPKVCFTKVKEYYKQIVEKVEEYYNTILNVDYSNIDKESLMKVINKSTISRAINSDYDDYVDYVKANQIKITGNAKAQEPIIYFDGLNYRLRVKLDFNIENSLTNENLLFYDLASERVIKYDNKSYSIVVDSVLASVFGTGTFYPKTTTLNTVIVGNDNPGIYEETRNVE